VCETEPYNLEVADTC